MIEKVCERRKIVETLQSDIESKLTKLGYDELDIEVMLHNALQNNNFDDLPNEVRSEYKIIPYVRKYEVDDEKKQECLNYIITTYSKWEDLSGDEKDYPHRKFTRTTKSGKESPDTFFCNNLCGFKDCPHIRKYLDTRENNTEEDDLF